MPTLEAGGRRPGQPVQEPVSSCETDVTAGSAGVTDCGEEARLSRWGGSSVPSMVVAMGSTCAPRGTDHEEAVLTRRPTDGRDPRQEAIHHCVWEFHVE